MVVIKLYNSAVERVFVSTACSNPQAKSHEDIQMLVETLKFNFSIRHRHIENQALISLIVIII